MRPLSNSKTSAKSKTSVRVATILLVFLFSAILFYGVGGIHIFGDIGGSAVAEQYLRDGSNLTGSTNIVNSIVWDFRGFDTLGEEIVFFTGAIGVSLVARKMRKNRDVSAGGSR